MAVILGIESTCDETAAAVVTDGQLVRSSIVSSQVDLHAKYRGVVPEIASRAHIENILPVIRKAVETSGIEIANVDAVAVAHRPGLIGSLLIGVTAAKTLAWALGKPLIAVDHVQAHLYSAMLDHSAGALAEANFPAIGLVCSGGHTALYRIGSWSDITMIGSTIDDAVGEAYDKVAAILGLGYPGGPIVDQLAIDGNPAAVKLPRTMLDRDSLDFSFSGLKTAVLYRVRGVPTRRDPQPLKPVPSEAEIKDVAASFQSACIDVLLKKLKRASEQFDARSILIGGGVSANRGLRTAMRSFPIPSFFPPMAYCTDNAAMIAGLADVHLRAKQFTGLDLDAVTYSQFRR